MQEVLTGNGRTALLLALGLLALPARGIEFGEIEILSPLGEKLDARIPLKTRPGEWFHVTCIALGPPGSAAALPAVPGGTLSVERRRDSANLRLRTAEPVSDPALGFSVTSTCEGASATATKREYSVLVDPPEVFARQQRGRAKAAPAPPPATAFAPPPVAAPTTRIAAPARAPAPPAVVPRSRHAPPSPRGEPTPQPGAASAKSDFVLKLTSAPMDLARTRQFDDKSRAQLRERLRLLDSDDQVAAMLSMQDNLRRLEARVAELQLKLATTTALAESQARPRAEPPAPQPPKVAAAPPAPEPVKIAPPAPPAAEPPKAAAPMPPEAEAAKPAVAPAKAPAAEAESRFDLLSALPGGPFAWAGGLAVVVLVLIAALIARRRRDGESSYDDSLEPHSPATRLMPREELEAPEPQLGAAAEHPFEVAAPLRPEIGSDAALATRLEEDTESLRRRYMEERFPEIRNSTINLDDPGSVVKGARLFYEDGATPRAVELLRFAIEDRPSQVRPWLALFEVYRLERLAGEYGELASRFNELHGNTEQWAKVRGLGRELDPANPLFQEPAAKPLETIGPREARRLGLGAVDPIAENWLEAPMDFENEVLATELRRALMARASVEDRDLVPNPMPALRSVEMFSVG